MNIRVNIIHTFTHRPGIGTGNVVSMPRLHAMIKKYLRYSVPGTVRYLIKPWMPVDKRIVIIGDGLQATELVEIPVKSGRKVTMVTSADTSQDTRIPMALYNRLYR